MTTKMMTRKGICALICGCILLLTLFAGCGSDQDNGRQVLVYYLDISGTSLVADAYSLEATVPKDEIEELLQRISDPPESDSFISPIPTGLKVESFSVSADGALRLDFGSDYAKVSGYSEVLLRAAIVRTLLQADDVRNVSFFVSGEPLTDKNGNAIGAMTADTFLEYGTNDQEEMENTLLVLYYASSDGQHLVRETRRVYYSSNIAVERLVLEYLMEQPKTEGSLIPIPAETTILGVSVTDGICYVNLDSTFLTTMDNVSQKVTIYAIVDSLCELDEVDQVQITVDGEQPAALPGNASNNGIYTPDLSLVVSGS